jgi:WD40 repeat protein
MGKLLITGRNRNTLERANFAGASMLSLTFVLCFYLAFAAIAAAPPAPPVLRGPRILGDQRGGVVCLAFSPDGKWLATGSPLPSPVFGEPAGQIQLWDVKTGTLRSTWKGHREPPASLVFSPDGKMIVSITSSFERIHWNVTKGRVQRDLPGISDYFWPGGLGISADGKQVGACGFRHLLVWDAVSGNQLFLHRRKSGASAGILSHDLRLAAVPEHQDVDLWDVRTGTIRRSLLDHPGSVEILSVSADDRMLAVACHCRDDNGQHVGAVSLWDVPRDRRMRTIWLGNLMFRGLALSPAGDLLAVAGRPAHGGNELRLFETGTGRELVQLRLSGVEWIGRLTFSPDNKMLAANCNDSVRLWTVRRPPAR